MTNELKPGDTIRCASYTDMLDTITDLTRCGHEVRVVARWTVKVEAVVDDGDEEVTK